MPFMPYLYKEGREGLTAVRADARFAVYPPPDVKGEVSSRMGVEEISGKEQAMPSGEGCSPKGG